MQYRTLGKTGYNISAVFYGGIVSAAVDGLRAAESVLGAFSGWPA